MGSDESDTVSAEMPEVPVEVSEEDSEVEEVSESRTLSVRFVASLYLTLALEMPCPAAASNRYYTSPPRRTQRYVFITSKT
jgi:hypothetical protein